MVTLQGFIVFVIAVLIRLERATPRRLSGLLVGLAGVSMVLLTRFDILAGAQNARLPVAMVLPALFAVEALLLAGKWPMQIDIFASVGIMMALSALFLTPIAHLNGDLMRLGPEIGRIGLLVVLFGLVGAASLLLAFHLVATAGAVFHSRSASAMTIAGVVLGTLVLTGERSFKARS